MSDRPDSFEHFRDIVEAEFGLPRKSLAEDTRLSNVAVFDSLGRLELLLMLESFGVEWPDELGPTLVTLGDVWYEFRQRAEATPHA